MQISRLIERVLRGEIRVPGFQRDFVWEPDRAALLMDSIYKEYPFGSILLWRTRTQLKTEKNLGTFELPEPEAESPRRVRRLTGLRTRRCAEFGGDGSTGLRTRPAACLRSIRRVGGG